MGFQATLSPELIDFINEQAIFFVASAAAEGRVNCSPKGMDTLRVLDHKTVAYLDLTGSGNETAAHVLHDGRLTIMLCSFTGKPLILRMYGKGSAVRPRDARWDKLIGHFQQMPGQRQIIVLDIQSVQTSCGFAVPKYELVGERTKLLEWCAKKGPAGVGKYWADKNQVSIDGLPTHLLEEQAGSS